ncbi:MAG: hypothetical protein NUW23_14650 [Firmicutes bacterium]|jgi:hypothetical protein|nr:hypothetical protein [Bacillota bacterium]
MNLGPLDITFAVYAAAMGVACYATRVAFVALLPSAALPRPVLRALHQEFAAVVV